MNKLLTKLAAVSLFVLSMQGNVMAETKNIDTEKSTIAWFGKKVLGKHNGNIKLQSGELTFAEGKPTAGKFVVDMNSITNNDLSGSDNAKIVGHLKSNDFFAANKYPTANLEITNISAVDEKNHQVKGNLTIRGITQPIEFPLTVDGNKASAKLTIDRSKFEVKFGSESFFGKLGDKAVYDDFVLEVNLVL